MSTGYVVKFGEKAAIVCPPVCPVCLQPGVQTLRSDVTGLAAEAEVSYCARHHENAKRNRRNDKIVNTMVWVATIPLAIFLCIGAFKWGWADGIIGWDWFGLPRKLRAIAYIVVLVLCGIAALVCAWLVIGLPFSLMFKSEDVLGAEGLVFDFDLQRVPPDPATQASGSSETENEFKSTAKATCVRKEYADQLSLANNVAAPTPAVDDA